METKCLIVEDEPAILRLVSIILKDLGCDILSAPDAESALEIVARTRPDLIIADVRLPGMNGVQLARRVRDGGGRLSSMPVLLMSAYGEPADHGCDGFLPKPFDIEDLAQFVGPYLARRS